MSFVSAAFIAFIALTGACYFAMPIKHRWTVLLVASYIFFFLNSHWLVLELFVQSMGTYLFARWMQKVTDSTPIEELDKKAAREAKAQARRQRKNIMLVGLVFNFGALLFLKYFDFFADNANFLLAALGVHIPSLGLIVPVGLSFYTLQAVAYLVDVQRGKIKADSNPLKFMLFMSYFPQILQGPIPRHDSLAHQLYEGHAFDYKNLCYGIQLILWGFFKKLIIADRLAIPVGQVFDNFGYYDGFIVFLAAAGYGLQVYADFSGGIDIARGFSQSIGITMDQNFRQPYFSDSVSEFWRRWHMTLGNWTRDYIFYPLSLSKAFSRLGKASRNLFGSTIGKRIPPFISMFLVFLFIGFWHGAEWRFIAYGVYNGIFIMLGILLVDQYAFLKEKFHVNETSAGWLLFQMFRTFVICAIGRFFSRASDCGQALDMFMSMFNGFFDWSFFVDGTMLTLGLDVANWAVLVTAIAILLLIDIAHEKDVHIRDSIARQDLAVRWLVYLGAVVAVVIFGVYGSGFDSAAFIYQQF